MGDVQGGVVVRRLGCWMGAFVRSGSGNRDLPCRAGEDVGVAMLKCAVAAVIE